MPIISDDPLRALAARWRDDEGGAYRTWFLRKERVKNFRSVRRGIQEVVREIEAGEFGRAKRGSSVETVVRRVAEQQQCRGADHTWLWKPKLHIPDIDESAESQCVFGQSQDACVCCNGEEQLLGAVRRLDARRIRGLDRPPQTSRISCIPPSCRRTARRS
jgi:type II restriction enzyme